MAKSKQKPAEKEQPAARRGFTKLMFPAAVTVDVIVLVLSIMPAVRVVQFLRGSEQGFSTSLESPILLVIALFPLFAILALCSAWFLSRARHMKAALGASLLPILIAVLVGAETWYAQWSMERWLE